MYSPFIEVGKGGPSEGPQSWNEHSALMNGVDLNSYRLLLADFLIGIDRQFGPLIFSDLPSPSLTPELMRRGFFFVCCGIVHGCGYRVIDMPKH